MLKKFLINSFIILILFNFNFSFAYNSKIVYLSSNKNNMKKGDEIEIKICIDNTKIAAFTAYIYFDNSKLELLNENDNLKVEDNKIILVWYDLKGGENTKEGELATIKFRAKETGIANFNIDGEFYDKNQEKLETTFKELQIEIENEPQYLNPSNTNLEILAIENVLLYPPFDANITSYEVETENNLLKILAVPENEKARVDIIGNQNLKVGNNTININVVSEDGLSNKTYKINAYKMNEEEKKEYIENQKENEEKLEKIYEVQTVENEVVKAPYNTNSSQREIKEVQEDVKKKSNNSLWIIVILIFVVVLIVWNYRREKKEKK